MKYLLLFDIDATLLLTHGSGIRAMQRAGKEIFGEQYSLEGIKFAGSLDSHIFKNAAERSGITNYQPHLEQFTHTYKRELEIELINKKDQLVVLPGIMSLLQTLREMDHVTLGLVTGNFALTAPIKLNAVGINPDWFTANGFGCMADYRPHLVPIAINTFEQNTGQKISPDRVVVIGDTPHDIKAGNENGCISFGVGTGDYTPEDLTAVGAKFAVKDLSDPTPLLNLVN